LKEKVYVGGLRFLLLPIIGTPSNIVKDGAYQFMLRIGRGLVKKGHYCYMMVPRGTAVDIEREAGIFTIEGDVEVRMFDHVLSTLDMSAVMRLFSPQLGKYPIDAAVVMSGEHAVHLTSCFSRIAYKKQLPVVLIETWVDWVESNSSYLKDPDRHMLNCLGYALSRTVFLTPRELRMAEDKSRYYGLSEAQIVRMKKQCVILPVSIEMDVLNSYKKKYKKSKKKRMCLFAGRTNAGKRPEKILKIFNELYKQGENIEVKYLTQSHGMSASAYVYNNGVFDEKDYIEPEYGAGVDRFYEEAAKGHLYMVWSTSEGYPVAVTEAYLLGMAVLIHDEEWSREVFHYVKDERFWFTTDTDGIEKARWITNNFAEAIVAIKPVIKYLLKEQDSKTISDFVEEVGRDWVSGGIGKKHFRFYGFRELMDDVVPYVAEDGEFVLEDLLVEIGIRAGKWHNDPLLRASGRKFPTNSDLHNLMRSGYGVADLCDKRKPRYRLND